LQNPSATVTLTGIFTDEQGAQVMRVWKIYKYIFPSVAYLKCTPSDKQMYP